MYFNAEAKRVCVCDDEVFQFSLFSSLSRLFDFSLGSELVTFNVRDCDGFCNMSHTSP